MIYYAITCHIFAITLSCHVLRRRAILSFWCRYFSPFSLLSLPFSDAILLRCRWLRYCHIDCCYAAAAIISLSFRCLPFRLFLRRLISPLIFRFSHWLRCHYFRATRYFHMIRFRHFITLSLFMPPCRFSFLIISRCRHVFRLLCHFRWYFFYCRLQWYFTPWLRWWLRHAAATMPLRLLFIFRRKAPLRHFAFLWHFATLSLMLIRHYCFSIFRHWLAAAISLRRHCCWLLLPALFSSLRFSLDIRYYFDCYFRRLLPLMIHYAAMTLYCIMPWLSRCCCRHYATLVWCHSPWWCAAFAILFYAAMITLMMLHCCQFISDFFRRCWFHILRFSCRHIDCRRHAMLVSFDIAIIYDFHLFHYFIIHYAITPPWYAITPFRLPLSILPASASAIIDAFDYAEAAAAADFHYADDICWCCCFAYAAYSLAAINIFWLRCHFRHWCHCRLRFLRHLLIAYWYFIDMPISLIIDMIHCDAADAAAGDDADAITLPPHLRRLRFSPWYYFLSHWLPFSLRHWLLFIYW